MLVADLLARLRAAGVNGVLVLRRHPRHVVLFAAVVGLAAQPLPAWAVLAAAGIAALAACRPALAPVAAAALLAGAAVAEERSQALGPGRLPTLVGEQISADVVLLEPVRTRANGTASARVRVLGARAGRGSTSARVSATRAAGEVAVARVLDGRMPAGARVGAVLHVDGRVDDLGRADAYQRRRGAHAALVVSRWAPTGAARGGLVGELDAARERASRALGVGLESREAALLRGMVIGRDDAVSDTVRTNFERSGLAHLLAVSGQNVLLLCTLVLALAAGLGLPLRTRLLLAAGIVVLYVPLAGGGPSIQRAGVMGVAGLVAALAGRPSSRWYALGLAAAVTLAVNPAVVGEPGWQLSFAAVVGLLALTPRLRDGIVRRGLPRALAEILAVTTAATLATAPLLAFHFEEVSTVSLPANLVAAPAVPPLMWLGMLSMTIGQIAPDLALPLNALNAPLLAYVDWVAQTAASFPQAAVPLTVPGVGWLAAIYAAGAAAIAAVVLRRRDRSARSSRDPAPRHKVVGAAAAVVAVTAAVVLAGVGLSRPGPPRPGELVVSFLDVGQGDATLLQLDGAAVLVDTGPPGGPVLSRLDEAGVERLDVLVLTHAQADHEGMALPVLRRYRPRLVVNGGAGWPSRVQAALRPAMRAASARELPARSGQALELGRLRVRVLWPPPPPAGWRPEGDPNRWAVVAHVSVGDFDLLLPADAESDVTNGLRLPRVEALKVAHHGSEDAGLPALLARVRPHVAAIEVGERNTYGHPAPSTLAALRAVSRVVRTDRDGTVRLQVRGRQITMERA